MMLNLSIVFGIDSERTCNNSECKVVPITTNGIPATIKCVNEAGQKLCILCYPGQNKTWYNMWINPKVRINLSEPQQYLEVYFGKNWSAVLESSKNVGFLTWPSFSYMKQEYGFEPFEPSCIGFLTDRNITVDFILKMPVCFQQILVGYLIVAGLVSFAVVYRYGPASDGRTLNLIQWTLQGIGLAFIYNGTQISEISIAIIVGAITLYFLPTGLSSWVKKIKYHYFRPKTKLLTEDEYITEGEIETTKALKELQEYCRSPNCDAWKTLSRLKSPNRFAQFISGEEHLSQEEFEQYEDTAEINPLVLDQDSSDSEYSDSELLSPPRHR
ncbi:Nuclear envelope integral membrane protein 1 [Bulinus truncatus]|nr:Nuclear envelope integral membrane protein 1 [Bulinus truncatus]